MHRNSDSQVIHLHCRVLVFYAPHTLRTTDLHKSALQD
ncbi:hypothetical protein T4A_599 [Trichinella pseudospiralis]|uniref:Uncharacterized protein n=1 Tax=Trichinella pseudospiralis TaxID=6337 RepID=A0A0V1DM74_TRIPS|nr:hypothetical protein T4A_599 [Trichinella pseudospiralis]